MENNQEQNLTKKERRAARKQEKLQQHAMDNQKKKTAKIAFWIIIAVIIAATVWGVSYLAKNAPEPVSQNQTVGDVSANLVPVSATDNKKGNEAAKAVLIEYSDLQCPACANYYPMLKQLGIDYADKVLIVYRHFPLRTIHQNAQIAAQAAEAAGLQGKFWQMHDLLFMNQESWANLSRPQNPFVEYALRLGLDKLKFEKDLRSDAVINKVDQDYASGEKIGINSTPTFILNGLVLQPPRSLEELKNLIDNELTK